MITRVLFAVGISTLALVACSSDVQGPSGGGTPGAGGSSSGASGRGGSSGGGTSGGSSSGASGGSSSGGSSSGGSSSGGSSGTPVTSDTWGDGKAITANVDIVAGGTVTISPGATINVSPGVNITVHGTLTGAAKASHAKLTGTGWGGVTVASGGSMSLTGVDLENTTTGIHVNGNDVLAQYDYGTMTGGMFTVDVGGTFKTDHAAVVKGGTTAVNGAFTATFLDYSGANVTMGDPSATVSVTDSKITGGGTGTDFFEPSAGKLLQISYTTIDSTHCPIHVSGVAKFALDHITTGGTGTSSTSAFGLMVYNPENGPHTVSYSNFNDPNWDQTQRTATITIDHSFIKATPATVGKVTITAPQSQLVAGAAPRGTPGPKG